MSPEPAHVPRASASIDAVPFLPADRRVADVLAEDPDGIHAQPDDLHEDRCGNEAGSA